MGLAGDDTLLGFEGDDWLDGGEGADTLQGGQGNDLYFVDEAGDRIVEAAGEGYDTVVSTFTWTLGAELEGLALEGSADIDGTGNALNNWMQGNAGDNVLTAGEGYDSLAGGAGNDTLDGGLGDDTYAWGRGDSADRLVDAGGHDTLSVLPGVDAEQIWFRQVGSNLELSVIGTGDSLTIADWYANPAARVERIVTAGGSMLLDTQVQSLVEAMATFAPPAAGQTTLAPGYQQALAPVLAASWQAAGG